MIKEFQGEFRWLSNFAPVDIKVSERIYPSVEHAYMPAKSEDKNWKDTCADSRITAGKIKRLSKRVELREDWDNDKLTVMEIFLIRKFTQEPFRTKLMDTGSQNIQEGNNWGDKFWGVCLKTGEGENHLGRLIMKIRDKLLN